MKKFVYIAGFMLAVSGVVLLLSSFPAAARESKLEQMFEARKTAEETVSAITEEDKAAITKYIEEKLMPKCPPGLAKKDKDCLPPGQRKKKYAVGEKIRAGIFSPAAGELLRQLAPLPKGYRYVRVDRDILLLKENGNIILDAVSLVPEMTEAEKNKNKRTYTSRSRLENNTP